MPHDPESLLISIITVCYNEPPDKIRKTSESVVSQDYPGIEWIVVDGGSSEETLATIREYSGKIAIFVSEPDKGIYDAMNKGIQRARGDFINFMNVGDSFISPHVVSEVVDAVGAHPGYDCYYGDVVYVNPASGGKRFMCQMPRVNLCSLYSRTVCHQAIFARRTLYEEIGGFDLQCPMAADRDWIIRTVKVGVRWLHTGITICEYDDSGISSDIAKRRVETARLLCRHYKKWQRALLYVHRKATRVYVRLRACCWSCQHGT